MKTRTIFFGLLMFALGGLFFSSRAAVGLAPCATSTSAFAVATALSTASADQGTQDNPIPLGALARVTVKLLGEDYTFDIAMTQVAFGQAAVTKLKSAGGYEAPPDGMTYLIAYVQGTFISGPSGKAANLNTADFLTISDGQLSQLTLISAPSPELQFVGFPKAKFKGWVALQMASDETNPLVGFGVNGFDGSGGVYFATH